MYSAVCLFVVSGALAHFSLLSGLLGVIVVAGAVVRMVAEGRLVLRRYPECAEYARRTPRMVPYVF